MDRMKYDYWNNATPWHQCCLITVQMYGPLSFFIIVKTISYLIVISSLLGVT